MRDRTKPVAAPEGYKWFVSRSVFSHYDFQLGLWRKGAIVNQDGSESREVVPPGSKKAVTVSMFGGCAAYELFNEPRQIYRTSKRILREFEREQARRDVAAEILGEVS